MRKPCAVCIHPERKAIEAAIEGGRSCRSVGNEYGIPKSTINRHMQPGHAATAGVRAIASPLCPVSLKREIVAITEAGDLVDEINRLVQSSKEVLAVAGDDQRLKILAIEQVRKNLETAGKLTGQLSMGAHNQQVQINAGISRQEYDEALSGIIRALEPFPEARLAVLASLEGITVVECPT